MKIEFWWIGKTNEDYLEKGIDVYVKRLKHYNPINIKTLKDVKNYKSTEDLKIKEGEAFTEQIQNNDLVILLDEKGKSHTSLQFSKQLQKWLLQSSFKRLIFVVAGAYGASEPIKSRANYKLSLSDMTFSHQMIRLFLVEQVYRAFTILKNEKYHNE